MRLFASLLLLFHRNFLSGDWNRYCNLIDLETINQVSLHLGFFSYLLRFIVIHRVFLCVRSLIRFDLLMFRIPILNFVKEKMSSRSSRTIYVGNLPGDIREREVEDLFSKVNYSFLLILQLLLVIVFCLFSMRLS